MFSSLSGSVEGCLRPSRGVGGCLGVVAGPCQSPHALGLDMSIRGGLGYSGLALGCEGGL